MEMEMERERERERVWERELGLERLSRRMRLRRQVSETPLHTCPPQEENCLSGYNEIWREPTSQGSYGKIPSLGDQTRRGFEGGRQLAWSSTTSGTPRENRMSVRTQWNMSNTGRFFVFAGKYQHQNWLLRTFFHRKHCIFIQSSFNTKGHWMNIQIVFIVPHRACTISIIYRPYLQ